MLILFLLLNILILFSCGANLFECFRFFRQWKTRGLVLGLILVFAISGAVYQYLLTMDTRSGLLGFLVMAEFCYGIYFLVNLFSDIKVSKKVCAFVDLGFLGPSLCMLFFYFSVVTRKFVF